MTTEFVVTDRFWFLHSRLVARAFSGLAVIGGLFLFCPVAVVGQAEPAVSRSNLSAQKSVSSGEPLYYYKGRTRVRVELDPSRVAVDGTSASLIQRNAARAGVSVTTGETAGGKVVLEISSRSRSEMTTQVGSLRRAVPGVLLQAVLTRSGMNGGVSRSQEEVLLFATAQVSFKPAAGKSVDELVKKYGLLDLEAVSYAPGSFIARVKTDDDLLGAVTTANRMQESGDAEWASPLIEEQKKPRVYWNDPMLFEQWYLENLGSNNPNGIAGNDLAVPTAWDMVTGLGVNIGINDDGVEWNHPDLVENMRLDISYDFNDNEPDPMPNLLVDYHGTNCAGVAAARGNNNIGISGVAPEAGIAGLRILGAAATDAQEAMSLFWKSDETLPANQIHVSSNSWGPPDSGSLLDGPGPLTEAAIEHGVQHGRNGKGIVYVWAAGNGRVNLDNINKDSYASNPRVIAVGSSNASGSFAYYSEMGAPMLVNAPGGEGDILTTDLMGVNGRSITDYRPNFLGTSAAAPMVAGVVALMLQANPDLTYRDVMHILVNTATQNRPGDSSWITNGAGRRFSLNYGFGRVNAAAAVAAAVSWQSVPEEQIITVDNIISSPTVIPDGNTGEVLRSVAVTAPPGFKVEQIELTADITHPLRGDVFIYVQSPSGTVSELIRESNDYGANFSYWRFRSVAHWGENGTGEWRVRFSDGWPNEEGTVNYCALRILGYVQEDASVKNWFLY